MQLHEINIELKDWELISSEYKRYIIVNFDDKYVNGDLIVFNVKDLLNYGSLTQVDKVYKITCIEHLLNEHSILSICELKSDNWRI